MRDRETVETALQAADTGHTVFATLHTTTAAQTLQQHSPHFFPADERPRSILLDLAASLEAVICQRPRAKTADGNSRVPVNEVMRAPRPPSEKCSPTETSSQSPKSSPAKKSACALFDQHLVELLRAQHHPRQRSRPASPTTPKPSSSPAKESNPPTSPAVSADEITEGKKGIGTRRTHFNPLEAPYYDFLASTENHALIPYRLALLQA